jgi:transposase
MAKTTQPVILSGAKDLFDATRPSLAFPKETAEKSGTLQRDPSPRRKAVGSQDDIPWKWFRSIPLNSAHVPKSAK